MKHLSNLQGTVTDVPEPKPTIRHGFHDEPVSGYYRHIGVEKDGSITLIAQGAKLRIPADELWKMAARIDATFIVPQPKAK